jgi:hypothetical protein
VSERSVILAEKNLDTNLSRAERLAMLEKDNQQMPLKIQVELLGISYSSLFYRRVPPSTRELAIKRVGANLQIKLAQSQGI